MRVALTGASGFVGRALQSHFEDCVILDRDDDEMQLLEKLQDVGVVINLAGAPILKRWSKAYKQTLFNSRIQTTQKLVNAINQSSIKHFISTSAIGIYPDNKACDENTTEIADDFLTNVVEAWEEEANKCTKPTAILRFGVVLGKNGGALTQMLPPFKMGVGGVIGDGKMMMSWITIDDLMGIYEHILAHHLKGIYNATTPNPISNYTFTKTLGKQLHRPTLFPLPTFILRLLYGEGATVLTGSKEVYPHKLLESGYSFKYPTIEEALQSILCNQPKK